MKYPALDVAGVDGDLLDAFVLDFSPTASVVDADRITYFFSEPRSRRSAADAVAAAWPDAIVSSRDVDDEDWARRSQENLRPVTVGRLTVAPPWAAGEPSPSPLRIVIAPSMGFGTGHHATTRLCLHALQAFDLDGRSLLDVGTGSAILAIAGRALGAREAVGIDVDADAIQAASENLEANPSLANIHLRVGDLRDATLPRADVVTANLTGALLTASAGRLLSVLAPGGTLIVSGLLAQERDDVVAAFEPSAVVAWEREEEGWIGLALNHRAGPSV